MAKDYQCPACRNTVDKAALICSNPECRKALAFCSSCRDITLYTLVEKASGKLGRDKFRCERCEMVGVKCVTWLSGGYCNGLASTQGRAHALCASCNERLGDLGRAVVGFTVGSFISGLLKRRH